MGAAAGGAAQADEQGPTRGPSISVVPGTGESRPPAERSDPRVVEVRRNALLAGTVGVVAAAVSIAYLGRATTTGAALDWVLTGVTAMFAVAWLWSLVDARTPLLVADAHGVRVRLGRTWEGLAWRGLSRLEHHPRRGLGRDGRIVLVPEATTPLLDGLDRAGRQQAALSRRLHGSPFAVPLGLSTRLTGADADELEEVLQGLAGGDTRILVVRPETEAETETETEAETEVAEVAEVAEISETPEPSRDRRTAARSEVQWAAGRASSADALPEAEALRRPSRTDEVELVEDTEVWGARVRPIARGGEAVEPLVLDDFSVEPASDPVIGPELAAARTRLSLSVDQLADRTRIRPHVLESIEVDDFAPCGGDFYARGHLRTLARVLGIDSAALVATYDERYADAPIDPRRVFAAELATGANGSIRGTRGGPSWTMLIAAVMVVVLAWSVARLVMDDPVELQPAPSLNGSNGPAAPVDAAAPVPLVVSAVGGGSTVTVTDSQDEVVFSGDLAIGESTDLEVSPPIRIEASDGGAIETVVDGGPAARLGRAGEPASDTLVPR